MFYLNINKVDYAEKMLNKVLKIDDIEFISSEIYTKTLRNLSIIYKRKKNYQQAISLLNQALECYNIRNEEIILIKLQLSHNYTLLQNYNKASAYLKELLNNDHEYTEDVQYYMAELCHIQEKHLDANKHHKEAIKIVKKKLLNVKKYSNEYIRLCYLNAFHNFESSELDTSIDILNSLLNIKDIKSNTYFTIICLLKMDVIYESNGSITDKKNAIDLILSCKDIDKNISYFNVLYNKYEILKAEGQNSQEIKDKFDEYYTNSEKITNEQYAIFIINYLKLYPDHRLTNKLQARFEQNIHSYNKEDYASACLLLNKPNDALNALTGINSPFAISIKIDAYIKLKKLTFAVNLIDRIINEKHIPKERKTQLTIKKIACLSDLKKHKEVDELLLEYASNKTESIANIYDIYFEYFLHLIDINRIDVSKNKPRHSYDILNNMVSFIEKENYQSKLIKEFYDTIIFNYSLLNLVFSENKEDLNMDYFLKSLNQKEDIFKADLVSVIFDLCQLNKQNLLKTLESKIAIVSNIITENCNKNELTNGNILSRLKDFLSNVCTDLKYIENNNIEFINSIEDFYKIKLSFPDKALYRGMNKATWEIEPTIIREKKLDLLDSYYLANFQREAYALSDINLNNYHKLDWFSLMQHHGNLSPLLDWTKSLNVALFFALYGKDKKNPGIPVICTMEYKKIETHDNTQKRIDNDNPKDIILFAPKVLHKRLNRQSGVFTYHSSEDLNIENHDNFFVQKYAISPAIINDLKNLLSKDNVNCSTIYPDLDFLSEYIRNDLNSNFTFSLTYQNQAMNYNQIPTINDTHLDRGTGIDDHLKAY